MFNFCTKTVFLGDSEKEFHKIRHILDTHSIHYKEQKVDHGQNTLLPGHGSARSFGGNFGTVKPIYEILVSEKDFADVQFLIKSSTSDE